MTGIDYSGWFFKSVFKYRNKCNIFLFNRLIRLTCYLKRVGIGRKVIFNGMPVIRRHPDSSIVIGDHCEFNSSKHSVLVGLHKPCTFVTLTQSASIVIGDHSGASGVTIVAAESVHIGNHVMIGANCTIVDNDFHHADPDKRDHEGYPSRPIIIEDNVFLGFDCFILKGVTIGRNSVIGAGSIVTTSIPPNAIAIGNPCKVIIKRNWNR